MLDISHSCREAWGQNVLATQNPCKISIFFKHHFIFEQMSALFCWFICVAPEQGRPAEALLCFST